MPLGQVNYLQVIFLDNEKSNGQKRQSEDINSNVLICREFGFCTHEKHLISGSFYKYIVSVHSNAQ